MRGFIAVCWALTVAGCMLGAFLVFSTLYANGAPQQAAAAALACAVTVIPYVFTRAIEGMRGDVKA
ncbi:hypothetical protein ACFFGH_06480 [Lysobacter korlensis]|uniref:Lipoprotein n=1 Tax=Lysobacter korlensis TaxID=553636 RepID=A0ABV6RKI0_9GAMM